MARMLTIMLLGPALLLTGCGEGVVTSPPADAPNGESGTYLFTVLYPIEDFLTPGLGYVGPMTENAGAEARSAYLSRGELTDKLIADIEAHTSPAAWSDSRSIRDYGGQLIITQTIVVHEQVIAHFAERREQMQDDAFRAAWIRADGVPDTGLYNDIYPLGDLLVRELDIEDGHLRDEPADGITRFRRQELLDRELALLRATVASDSWDAHPEIRIRYYRHNLIIVQTIAAHRQIAAHLASRQALLEAGTFANERLAISRPMTPEECPIAVPDGLVAKAYFVDSLIPSSTLFVGPCMHFGDHDERCRPPGRAEKLATTIRASIDPAFWDSQRRIVVAEDAITLYVVQTEENIEAIDAALITMLEAQPEEPATDVALAPIAN